MDPSTFTQLHHTIPFLLAIALFVFFNFSSNAVKGCLGFTSLLSTRCKCSIPLLICHLTLLAPCKKIKSEFATTLPWLVIAVVVVVNGSCCRGRRIRIRQTVEERRRKRWLIMGSSIGKNCKLDRYFGDERNVQILAH